MAKLEVYDADGWSTVGGGGSSDLNITGTEDQITVTRTGDTVNISMPSSITIAELFVGLGVDVVNGDFSGTVRIKGKTSIEGDMESVTTGSLFQIPKGVSSQRAAPTAENAFTMMANTETGYIEFLGYANNSTPSGGYEWKRIPYGDAL